MSSILDEFSVFKTIDPKLKNAVKLFGVIKAINIEDNVGFFVTKDDQVYGPSVKNNDE